MAISMTKKQVQELNNKCSSNWELDVFYFLNWNQKTLIKRIPIEDNNYLEFTLYYNNQNQITLNIGKFHQIEEKGIAISDGMGKTAILNETIFKRKNVNNLIEYTNQLTDNELLKINAEAKVKKSDGLFLQSEDF